jgi:membrane associated rhomboid family serine protease
VRVSVPDPGPRETWPLRRSAAPIQLGAEGVYHPRTPRGGGSAYTPYAELSHVAVLPRVLWIGTRRDVYALPRILFAEAAGPEGLAEALLARVGQGPRGVERLARMQALDRWRQSERKPLATWALAALCSSVFALQWAVGPALFQVGYMSRALVADGDVWRTLTAGLLHVFPGHLIVNLVGLLVFGRIVERALGTPRTLCVMGVAEVVSMAAAALRGSGGVAGVSGVVLGLAGALLFVEFFLAAELPAPWRFPRWLLRALLLALAVDTALGLAVPIISVEAHLGGFAGGFLAASVLTRAESLAAPAGATVRAVARAVVILTTLSVGAASVALLRPDDFRASHAARLAHLTGLSPSELNDWAWVIAIDADSTPAQLEAALQLAERAVKETHRRNPTLLDTLAEVYFQLGRVDLAVGVIDEAIRRDPREPYYREQRRRFTGERAPDDRPQDPVLPWREAPGGRGPGAEEEPEGFTPGEPEHAPPWGPEGPGEPDDPGAQEPDALTA